jgi:DNA-directed RNA polymerase specialized sigma24 family protein
MAERRARSRLGHPGDVAPPPGEATVEIARVLAELPRRQREVAVLRYLLEMSTAEVAAVLSIGEGTVKSSLARARMHLADALRIDDDEVTEVANDVEGR